MERRPVRLPLAEREGHFLRSIRLICLIDRFFAKMLPIRPSTNPAVLS